MLIIVSVGLQCEGPDDTMGRDAKIFVGEDVVMAYLCTSNTLRYPSTGQHDMLFVLRLAFRSSWPFPRCGLGIKTLSRHTLLPR